MTSVFLFSNRLGAKVTALRVQKTAGPRVASTSSAPLILFPFDPLMVCSHHEAFILPLWSNRHVYATIGTLCMLYDETGCKGSNVRSFTSPGIEFTLNGVDDKIGSIQCKWLDPPMYLEDTVHQYVLA